MASRKTPKRGATTAPGTPTPAAAVAAPARAAEETVATPAQEIDYWRQLDVFSPADFKKPVTIIGAGATGSYVAWGLAKMGVRNLTVFDFDRVDSHNPPNQTYGRADHGRLKVEALRDQIRQVADIEIKAVPERFESGRLAGIVFVLTDSMDSRKKIWTSSIRYKPAVELCLETRLSAQGGWVFAVRPLMPKEVAAYEKTFCSDEEAEEPACTNRAIASTVMTIAGVAVHQMINFVNGQTIDNEVCVSLSPLTMISRRY